MPRHFSSFVFALLALLFANKVSSARDQLYSISFPQSEGQFFVLKDVPYLAGKDAPPVGGNALDLKPGGKIVHYGSKLELTYPLDVDEPVIVTLGGGEGRSAVWDRPEKETRKARVTATEGKFKGWYLDWTDVEEELKLGNREFRGRRLILKKDAGEENVFSVYPVAP